jgi:integrase
MAGLKPTTLESYRRTLKKYVYEFIGDISIASITPPDIAEIIGAARLQPTSQRTVQYVYTIIRRILQIAADWQLLESNPVARVKRPTNRPKEKNIWDMNQTRRFLDLIYQGKGSWDYFFLMAIMGGFRLSELLGLMWTDINFESGSVKIERSLVELDKLKFVMQTPKSKSSLRTVNVSPEVLEKLKGQPRLFSFVFRRPNGEPPSRSTLRSAFVTACKHAEVPYIGVHGLRHQHVSLLAEAGVSVKEAQERVGHSTPQITLNIYTHTLASPDKKVSQALDNFLKKD